MGVIDTAITWILGIEQGNHGYNQDARTGPDYDCSSLVTHAYIAAGVPLNSWDSTGNMLTDYTANGFDAIPYTSTVKLNPGDVIFAHREGLHHAVMYIVDETIVQASSDERGQYHGGAPGDQTGNEINKSTLNRSKKWQYVLRYRNDVSTMYHSSADIEQVAVNNAVNCSADPQYRPVSGITVYSDVRNGTPNDRHDMTIREIGYWADNAKFVTDKTEITISAINYTTLLGNLYDQFAEYYPGGYSMDTSNFTGTIRICLNFFGDRGLNPAACAGVTACLFVLSGIGTHHNGGGICDWQGKYKQQMHLRVLDWSTNLSGQLEFLWNDLTVNYNTMIQLLNSLPITDNGARRAANRFMVSYRYTDAPQDVNTELSRSTSAQNTAASWFNNLIIRAQTPVGTSYSSPTAVTIPTFGSQSQSNSEFGNIPLPSPIVPVTLPDPNTGVIYDILGQCTYPQTGINTAFTSYSSWYNDWNRSSPQYKLSHIWSTDWGCSCDRGIATVNGCYLIAVAPTYGSVGTALHIELDNGASFDALIADIKSPSDANYCPWGHLDGNGRVNIIEWEVVKVLPNGRAATSGDRYAGYPPDLSGWQGANVKTITNLGKMYDLRWT